MHLDVTGAIRLGDAVEELAAVRAAQRNRIHTVKLLGVAHALRETLGAPLPPVDRADYESVLTACQNQLGEAVFNNAWSEGKIISLEQAIHIAFGK